MNTFNINISNKYKSGDDFYNWINYNWVKNTVIPNDHQRWGTFNILSETVKNNTKILLENTINSSNKNYNKLGILYVQGQDINKRSNPSNFYYIQKLIKEIESCVTKNDLFNKMIDYDLSSGVHLPIAFIIQSDFKNSNINILHLSSPILGLPSRDYYFLESKEEIRIEYIKFIKKYSTLFGLNLNADDIFNLEKLLADKIFSSVEQRDMELFNNPTNYDDLILKNPNLSFISKIFNKANKVPGKINIINPNYITHVNKLIDIIELSNWKNYFIFKLILEFSKYLTEEIETCVFNFYYVQILGIKKMFPLWERIIHNLNAKMGDLIGELYIKKYFDSESKNTALKIILFIKNEFLNNLKNNNWMEEQTKKKAIDKLNKMNIKVGYPKFLRKKYDKLNITNSNTLLQNILNVKKFNIDYILNTLYEPVNKEIWYMNPHSINAYYSSANNEIVFPAGILQKPFFSINQDMALNFGCFGMVVGHEITHAFDDQGSKFDENGNFNNWWTENDKIKYDTQLKILVNQFDNYYIDGHKINGLLTLGENIADIGGLALSYNAFMHFLKLYPQYNTVIDSFTAEQRFFISYAMMWKTKATKEDIAQKILTDSHAPPIFRVNGVIRNNDNFYKAFNITSYDKLYLKPEERVKIWT